MWNAASWNRAATSFPRGVPGSGIGLSGGYQAVQSVKDGAAALAVSHGFIDARDFAFTAVESQSQHEEAH